MAHLLRLERRRQQIAERLNRSPHDTNCTTTSIIMGAHITKRRRRSGLCFQELLYIELL